MRGFRHSDRRAATPTARRASKGLRHRQTPAEQKIWSRVGASQVNGCKFRRQHALGPYVVDFVCLERKIVIEIDGSGHAIEPERDVVRDQTLNDLGFTVLRFWNSDVDENIDGVLEAIRRAVE